MRRQVDRQDRITAERVTAAKTALLASDAHIGASCNLHRGCMPYLAPPELAAAEGGEDDKFVFALETAKKHGLAKSGDKIVLAHGMVSGKASLTNFRMVVLA